MKSRPTATDEEIKGYMNFDSVVKQHQSQRASRQKLFRNSLLILAGATVGLITFWAIPSDQPVAPAKETVMVKTNPPTTTSPVDSASTQSTKPAIQEKPVEINVDHQEKPAATKKTEAQEKSISEKKQADSPAFQYHEAEPIGGYPNLYNYFSNELKYPPEALPDSIEGVVSVYFIINAEGKPEKISIQNSLGPAFDRETIRLIENMPPWKAAQLNNKSVPAKISLPITFQIIKPKAPQP